VTGIFLVIVRVDSQSIMMTGCSLSTEGRQEPSCFGTRSARAADLFCPRGM
jgi:hypothetical protein